MTPQSPSFCQHCGTQVPAGSKFCQKCGAPAVPGGAAAPVAAAPVASAPVASAGATSAGLTNFTRVRQLFDQASAIEPSQRDAWLQQACQGDAALLTELRGMLTARYDTFLAQSPPPPQATVAHTASPSPTAQFIGVYRLVRELGRGGMGVVYLAVRDDGAFRKNVALKLLLREQVNEESSSVSNRSGKCWPRSTIPILPAFWTAGTRRMACPTM